MTHNAKIQFLRFALVGAAGFLVDASVLYMAMNVVGAGHYTGRLISYLAAATFTWICNRHYTFSLHRSPNLLSEWARFLAANSIGGLVNYSTYAVLVAVSATVSSWPILGVAAGSIAGLSVNFTLSRRLVFTGVKTDR